MNELVNVLESTTIANEVPVEEEEEEEDESTVEKTVEDTVEKLKITSNNIPKLNQNSNWQWKLLTNNDDNASCFLDTGKMKTIFNDIHRKQKEIFEERVSLIKEYCILTFRSKDLFFPDNMICKFINDSCVDLSKIEYLEYIETKIKNDENYVEPIGTKKSKLKSSFTTKFNQAFYTVLVEALRTILNSSDRSTLKEEERLVVDAIEATGLGKHLLEHLYESQLKKTEILS